MKKYLFIALAALGFAACSDTMDTPNGPIQGGELEESYIAINLMAADNDTRAATDSYGYEDGTELERKINSAHFFFFDENGDPFNVTTSAPGGEKNHLSLTIGDTTGKVDPNVSDIKEAVLVLNTYKGVYPSQIVAVLNWVPTENTYTLDSLHGVVENSLGNDSKGYVMSNSVYMDRAGKMVDAVPLTAANIKTTPDAALEAPIEIYVERTAAKVVLTASGKVENTTNIFDTQKNSSAIGTLTSLNNVDVYVKLLGWELYNDYATSSLLKNIDVTWTIDNIGFNWNDYSFFRCYWAQSQNTNPDDEFAWKYTKDGDKDTYGGFPTACGFDIASTADYTDRTTYTYCGENTNGEAYRTKVILKGQLMQKIGDNYEQLELARWYGNEYAGNEALRTAVANSLKYILYYYDTTSGDYVSIAPADLECVKGADVGAKAYEVGFKLSTAGETKTWYQYSSAEGYKVFGDSGEPGDNAAKTNEYLKGVEPALLYTNGMTYYIVDIKHLGATGKTAEYGVVRNHVYQIDINSISGYGSPVYSGDIGFIKPEYPTEDEASYVAARINVLSWKVVKQGVDIVQ